MLKVSEYQMINWGKLIMIREADGSTQNID